MTPEQPLTGERLRHLREARHLTQEQLGKAVQVGAKTIRNWESGRTIPRSSMGALIEFFRQDERPEDPLLAASDADLLLELLRRAHARGNDARHG